MKKMIKIKPAHTHIQRTFKTIKLKKRQIKRQFKA